MKKHLGITEPYWSTLPEDKRFLWKVITFLVAALSSFLITKTGFVYIDGVLSGITGIFIIIIIQTQRSYSKLTPKLRKRSTRIAISVGTLSITLLGIVFFSQAALTSFAQVWSTDVAPIINSSSNPIIKQAILISSLIIFLFATIKAFRQLRFDEIIYKLPHDKLKELLIKKQPKAIEFSLFAFIELSILVVCYTYMSSLAEIINIVVKLVA